MGKGTANNQCHEGLNFDTGWPDLPDIEEHDPQADVKRVLYEAKVRRLENFDESPADFKKAQLAYKWQVEQSVFAAYVDVAKGSIDRAQTRAQFIEVAAAAIGSIYTGILALTFKAEGTNARPLPSQGFIPVVFLGLAVFLSAIYVSFLTPGRSVYMADTQGDPWSTEHEWLKSLSGYVFAVVERRVPFLHAAIVSLGFGIIFLPVSYFSWPDTAVFISAGIAGLIILVSGIMSRFIFRTSGGAGGQGPGEVPTPPTR